MEDAGFQSRKKAVIHALFYQERLDDDVIISKPHSVEMNM